VIQVPVEWAVLALLNVKLIVRKAQQKTTCINAIGMDSNAVKLKMELYLKMNAQIDVPKQLSENVTSKLKNVWNAKEVLLIQTANIQWTIAK